MMNDDIFYYEIDCVTCKQKLWDGYVLDEISAEQVDRVRANHLCPGAKP